MERCLEATCNIYIVQIRTRLPVHRFLKWQNLLGSINLILDFNSAETAVELELEIIRLPT
jgi:hypothetical protein